MTGLDVKHLVYMTIGHVVLKIYVPSKHFHMPNQYLPCKAYVYTAGKISTCPDWKITCPVGHVSTKVYVPWDKIHMPRVCGHALMSSPEWCFRFKQFSQIILVINGWHISCKIALTGPYSLWSTLVQVMAWCRQTVSCYLSLIYSVLWHL